MKNTMKIKDFQAFIFQRNMNKKALAGIRASFMILNLVVAVIAFSFLIGVVSAPDPGGDTGSDGCGPGGCDGGTEPTGGGGTSTDDNGGTDPIDEEITGGGTDTGGEGPDRGGDDKDGGGDGDGGDGGDGGPGGGWGDLFGMISWKAIIQKGAIGAGLFSAIGSVSGGDNGAFWGALAGSIGGAVAGLLEGPLQSETAANFIGLGIAAGIFILTYYKISEDSVEFVCSPWQAPIGGEDCQICNEFKHCSEYMCKSLGQACDIINPGTLEQKCIWLNPHDVNSPIIKMTKVSKDHRFVPDKTRPSGTGVTIMRNSKSGSGCVQAFFPLEFSFITRDSLTGVGEPSQCRIDYTLTKGTSEDPRAAFEKMKYYVGGDELFKYNHTEKLSLPGPDAINAVAPELKNDGEYTLFVRCQDANGNFNHDAYSVSFCVEKGPDATAPLIVSTSIENGKPIQFNQTSVELEVYVNEPSECRWSREDRDYDNMEEEMGCSTRIWEMNNQQVYTCKTVLNGIKDRVENKFYFKCKDQPWAEEGDRNENKQSYLYTVIGTQPLNIMEISPNETIYGATDTIPVFLEIKTDNGHKNGEALCYYYNDKENNEPLNEEDYVLFHESGENYHKQRQDLHQGNYKYYFKCVDLGGNAVYESVDFNVEVDRLAPIVVRAYRENELKIITNEQAVCSYSNTDCNFEIESGIEMESVDGEVHTSEWVLNKNYYIRCKDDYDNQPYPNVCSIIARPSQNLAEQTENIGWSFEV